MTRLAELVGRVRGSPIESYGSMDLLLRGAGGEPRRIMQADESVYLHPARARLPGPAAMVHQPVSDRPHHLERLVHRHPLAPVGPQHLVKFRQPLLVGVFGIKTAP